jgi:hypothetical protein
VHDDPLGVRDVRGLLDCGHGPRLVRGLQALRALHALKALRALPPLEALPALQALFWNRKRRYIALRGAAVWWDARIRWQGRFRLHVVRVHVVRVRVELRWRPGRHVRCC